MTATKIVQEHRGLAKVHSVCAEMNAIWRATHSTDLGIDGQMEFLEPATAISTGQLIAVQVKSGPSYFTREREDAVEYYPEQKHRKYWMRINLPVILVLHNPDAGRTIYARVKHQLAHGGPIRVPLDCEFEPTARDALLGIAQEDAQLLSAAEILADLAGATYAQGAEHELNGVHFLLASIHPGRTYFELRMCRLLALLNLASDDHGVSINADTYEFLHRCVLKIWKHQLTESFVGDFEESWYVWKMVPDIAVPLTPMGIAVFEHLWTNIDAYVDPNNWPSSTRNAQGIATAIALAAQAESDRLDESDRLGEVPR